MISIIGGTYNEICLHPPFREKYGSGLRACHAIHNLDAEAEIEFYTYAPESEELNLKIQGTTLGMKVHAFRNEQPITFYYDYPLKTPVIYPRPDLIISGPVIALNADHILYYGMMEGQAKVTGKKVVYDPQSPVKPISFKQTGSVAQELAIVINLREAGIIAGTDNEQGIKDFFLNQECASILVLKMGPKGAKVYLNSGEVYLIPVYKTFSVWPIGSGDVFAAIFAYHWMEASLPADQAAEKASFITAMYCNTKNYRFEPAHHHDYIQPLKIKDYPKGKVYLAGPFFHFRDKWLINEAFICLKGLKMDVFSPWHDIGEGTVEDGVAEKDIVGLEACSVVFAIVDGLDSGTLFEIGYAVKKGMPVIVYCENEPIPALTMLIGTGCVIEKDLTTALYKCLWMLAENE